MRFFLRVLVFLVPLALAQQAFAIRVNPMIMELDTVGNKSSVALYVENSSAVKATVEITAFALSMDSQGKESLKPAGKDFLIYPPQMIIAPNKSQTVRIRYVGEPKLAQSQAYRISVKQLPINLSNSSETSIGMAFDFITLLNVSPKGAKPQVQVAKIQSLKGNMWRLVFNNSGNKFVRLSETTWLVTDKNQTKELDSITIGAMVKTNLILPHSMLETTIPAIEGFDPQTTSIKINY